MVTARLIRAMPYHAVAEGEPLLVYGIRQVRWAGNAPQLLRYSLQTALIVQVIILVLWVMFVYATPNRLVASSYIIFSATISFFGWLFLAGLAGGLLLDCLSAAYAVAGISGEISARRWDLIRLSSIPAEQFIRARYTIAQARAWRVMAVVSSMRLGVLLIALLGALIAPDFLLVVLNLLLFAGGYWLIYCIEPLWRMRAITALGLAIAARAHRPAMALVAALSVTATLWIVQALFAALLLSIVSPERGFSGLFLCVVCGPLIALPLGWGIYGFYRYLQTRAVDAAIRHAFLPD